MFKASAWARCERCSDRVGSDEVCEHGLCSRCECTTCSPEAARRIVKTCSCGDKYTIDDWHTNAVYRGALMWDAETETELRDCATCGSTIGLLVDKKTKWPVPDELR